ncbi:hypothetical protein J4444_03680 [Candidatus Woesearchaeota archaeon]|nr:hypothetical protein [Candidatus Woesearchaeota archaeon]
MNTGLGLYFHLKKKVSNKTKLRRLFNNSVYFFVVLGPIFNLPQLFSIWINKNASGVSYLSWFGFSIISTFWFTYGLIHREKPIIITNSILIIIQLLIAFGTLRYS